MKVAKRFRWESAHRLPKHPGECSNLHGHSYCMTVELEGNVIGSSGILIDFKEVKTALQPLIGEWDHATLVSQDDVELRRILSELDTKVAILPFETTAENLCRYVADYLLTRSIDELRERGIASLGVRLYETDTCYAELRVPVEKNPSLELRLGPLRKVTTRREAQEYSDDS